MIDHRLQIKTALQATFFHSPTTYSWFGRQSQKFPPSVVRALTPETARAYLVFTLQSQLYSDFYCPGFVQPPGQLDAGRPAASRTPFVEELASANAGAGYWTTGWVVQGEEGRELLVHRQGLSLWVLPEEYSSVSDSPLAPGTNVRLRFPKEFLALSPGFYMALGDEELVRGEAQTVVRWYWHLTPPGAVRFLRSATQKLNQAHLPFKLKVLNDPTRFTRCDAVVLYILKSDYTVASQLLMEIYSDVAGEIQPRVPVFTKELAPGVGLAEDPGQGESFGLHRCALLAEGMVRAYELRKQSLADRLAVVEACFASQGIQLDQPFLNPGAGDDYSFPLPAPRRVPALRAVGNSQPETDTEPFLQAAVALGSQLVQDAVWWHGRCNWMGAEPDGHTLGSGRVRMTCKALGPELYAGTSGVALFLAELCTATGDGKVRAAALGAIRQALAHCDAVAPVVRFGLYSGWSGIAFAAARVGALLGEPELLHAALRLARRLSAERQAEREYDLLAGTAGAVATLLILADMLDDASLLHAAARLGDELLQAADKTQAGYSWHSSSFPKQPNLTGFSHGAAGVAYALLELFRATGEPGYRHAAEQAFAYERHWYDEEAGNWPDLRTHLGRRRDARLPLSFATAWCHGAPGIALARLRAYQLSQDETYKAEALAALQTTHTVVAAGLYAGTGTYSLCHGLAGNADILLSGCQVLDQDQAQAAELARDVARTGIERYLLRGREWPCGPGGETPGLMLGLAGIGYFYLRMHDLSHPSVLMLQHESFCVMS
jgi:hypothetical protein